MRKGKILALAAGIALFFGVPAMVHGEQEGLPAEEPEMLQAESADQVELDTGNSSNNVQKSGTILNHIYLENVDLSGMTEEEALQAAEKRMEEINGYRIMLHMDDQSVGVPAKELGVSGDNQKTISHAAKIGQIGNVIKRYKAKKDLEREPLQLSLHYQVDESAVRAALEQYCTPLNREVKDYGLIHDGGVFKVTNGQRGVTLKTEESVQRVKNYLTTIWKDGIGSIDLETETTEPRGSIEELARVTTVLGQGSTDYSSSSAARATNIKNGTRTLSGKVLYPGDTLSVCTSMMPFTEENGYKMAPSYANGEVVESFGGGICQVSTTLYLAVLRAELEVTERHNHSMIVNYVKPSMDAAIAEGSKDFRIRNNLDAPIYIEGYAGGGTLSFAIYGEEYRPEGRSVRFESETLQTIEPTVELKADTTMAFGVTELIQNSHTGYTAKLWKIITENGEETKEEVNTSHYMMAPKKYKVGVKTDDMAASNAMYAAIASNDLNKVYEVSKQY